MIQSPLKSALMGSLVRTLLIQVQKTKVRPTRRSKLTTDGPIAITPIPRPPPSIPTAHIRIRRCRPIIPNPIRSRRIPPKRVER